jgi:hypothetical protein
MFDPGEERVAWAITLDAAGMMNNVRMNVHSQVGWT